MSQLQMHDKIKKVSEAVKQDDLIKERPKKIGLRLFFIFAILSTCVILLFAVLLAFNSYFKTAFFFACIAICSIYVFYKLITADDLQPL